MKINIITGGSRGLGRAIALHLAAKGQDSIITYNSSKDAADEVVKAIAAQGRKAVALALDVSKPASFDAFAASVKQALAATWQRDTFDHLVNNAGIGMYVPIPDVTEARFDEIMTIHLKAPYFITQKLLPLMQDGGHIINISSGLTRMTHDGSSVYAMMKGGIEVFTRYLAKELGPRRITANTVAPGAIQTDFGGGRVRNSPDLQKMLTSSTALGRVANADDIGSLVAAMLTSDFGWVNGQRIEASGGIML